MTPPAAFETAHAAVYLGDVRAVLQQMDDESVHCIVTSPPYWNQRDYSAKGQIGLERTPQAYLAALRPAFVELRRVLRTDGVMFVNMGDGWANRVHGKSQTYGSSDNRLGRGPRPTPMRTATGGLKVNDLIGMPWRLAFMLQEDGWWLRQEIIWYKPNAMPESATNRPSRTHEQIFLFTRRGSRYHFDWRAIAEPVTGEAHHRGNGVPPKAAANNGGGRQNGSFSAAVRDTVDIRNSRSVWEIQTEKFPEAHFATFPREVPRRCILAGCPVGGTVLDPFAGSGTTLEVAIALGRRALGIELARPYLAMIEKRIAAGEMEWSRQDGRIAGAPLKAVTVSDMGPLWRGTPDEDPESPRLKQDSVDKATYTGFNKRWKTRSAGGGHT